MFCRSSSRTPGSVRFPGSAGFDSACRQPARRVEVVKELTDLPESAGFQPARRVATAAGFTHGYFIRPFALDAPASLKLHGKGRKERAVPLWARTARVPRTWLQELGDRFGNLAFPSARARRLFSPRCFLSIEPGRRPRGPGMFEPPEQTHIAAADSSFPMHLLQAGVDPAVIALGSAMRVSKPHTATSKRTLR